MLTAVKHYGHVLSLSVDHYWVLLSALGLARHGHILTDNGHIHPSTMVL